MLLELPQVPARPRTPHDQPYGGTVPEGRLRSPIHVVDAQLCAVDPAEEVEDASVAVPDRLLPSRADPPPGALRRSRDYGLHPLRREPRSRLRGVEANEAVQVALANEGRQMAMQQGVERLHFLLARRIPGVRGGRQEDQREEGRSDLPHDPSVYHT